MVNRLSLLAVERSCFQLCSTLLGEMVCGSQYYATMTRGSPLSYFLKKPQFSPATYCVVHSTEATDCHSSLAQEGYLACETGWGGLRVLARQLGSRA